jgi:hypothetical protein
LLVAHLISPPGLAAPAGIAVLETLDGRAASAQSGRLLDIEGFYGGWLGRELP